MFIHLPERKRIHFFDEITLKSPGYSDKPQTQRMADVLKDKYKGKQLHAYPDATGEKRQTSATESDLSILRQNGIRVYARASNPSVRDRLNAANKMFGELSVTVDGDRCPELVEDLEKCERDKYGDLDKNDSERTHASDAGTYPIAYLYPIKHREFGGIAR